MKLNYNKYKLLLVVFTALFSFSSCKKDDASKDTDLLHSFSVVGKDAAFFRATINDDNTVTIKVSPYLDAEEMLSEAVPTFYLAKGATVSPDPSVPQNFAQAGGVNYTITAEDGVSQRTYNVSWGISDHLAEGEGFSYAEIGASKFFPALGYPGEVENFGFADSKLYGDLHVIPAYSGDYIVLLSRAYIEDDPGSPHAVKVFDKSTLAPAGNLNLGPIQLVDLKLIASDYRGNMVGMVVVNNKTEFFVWSSPTDAPKSIGTIDVNMAPMSDGGANFQVAGDVSMDAWITAAAPRSNSGEHYRVKVTSGSLAASYSIIKTGHSSTDGAGFQMISPINAGDEPAFVVGDTDGAPGTANSIKAYINSFAGSSISVMPGYWQNILQTWWIGTGFSTSRYGGRAPFVSSLVVNGKSYVAVTSGSAWWHAAAVLSSDLQSLAHENLNIAVPMNRGWSFGSYADWYYDEDKKEAYLAFWFGREGLRTYKLTCFE